MFAKRVVTKAVTRQCLFCDSCMAMVDEDEKFIIAQFALTKGETYRTRNVTKRDRYIICEKCYETVTGAYEVHQQVIRDGSEGTFRREGITDAEMRALFEMNRGGKNKGVAEPVPEDGAKVNDDEPPKRGWLWRLPLKAAM